MEMPNVVKYYHFLAYELFTSADALEYNKTLSKCTVENIRLWCILLPNDKLKIDIFSNVIIICNVQFKFCIKVQWSQFHKKRQQIHNKIYQSEVN